MRNEPGTETLNEQPPEVFYKKVFLKVFLQANDCDFIKRQTLTQIFSCEFSEFLATPFLQNTSGRLLVDITIIRAYFVFLYCFQRSWAYQTIDDKTGKTQQNMYKIYQMTYSVVEELKNISMTLIMNFNIGMTLLPDKWRCWYWT